MRFLDRFKSNADRLKEEKEKQRLLQEAISLEMAKRETLNLTNKLDKIRNGSPPEEREETRSGGDRPARKRTARRKADPAPGKTTKGT